MNLYYNRTLHVKNILIGFAILISAGVLLWTGVLSYHSHGKLITSPNSIPDAFMDDVVAVVLDKQGKPSLKIEAPKVIHYAENDTTRLITPHLTIYRKSPQPWYVTSQFARATEGTERVLFWGDVMIQHPADPASPATVINTSTLTVYPNKQTAETADPVTMRQPSMVVTSVGMYADMNTGDIKLLSQAKGEYVPGT